MFSVIVFIVNFAKRVFAYTTFNPMLELHRNTVRNCSTFRQRTILKFIIATCQHRELNAIKRNRNYV